MINENEVQITISGNNQKDITEIANEIYDRLNRLGYILTITDGDRYAFTNKSASIPPPIYIKTRITPPVEHDF